MYTIVLDFTLYRPIYGFKVTCLWLKGRSNKFPIRRHPLWEIFNFQNFTIWWKIRYTKL